MLLIDELDEALANRADARAVKLTRELWREVENALRSAGVGYVDASNLTRDLVDDAMQHIRATARATERTNAIARIVGGITE